MLALSVLFNVLSYAQVGTKPFGRNPFATNGAFGTGPFGTGGGNMQANAVRDDSGNLVKDDSGNQVVST